MITIVSRPTIKVKPVRLSFDEIVERLARNEARAVLERELDKQDLPLPKEAAVEKHIDEILRANPQIRVTARERIEAKQVAVEEIFAQTGISGPEIDLNNAIEVEL